MRLGDRRAERGGHHTRFVARRNVLVGIRDRLVDERRERLVVGSGRDREVIEAGADLAQIARGVVDVVLDLLALGRRQVFERRIGLEP